MYHYVLLAKAIQSVIEAHFMSLCLVIVFHNQFRNMKFLWKNDRILRFVGKISRISASLVFDRRMPSAIIVVNVRI